jgi:hypothetical protein
LSGASSRPTAAPFRQARLRSPAPAPRQAGTHPHLQHRHPHQPPPQAIFQTRSRSTYRDHLQRHLPGQGRPQGHQREPGQVDRHRHRLQPPALGDGTGYPPAQPGGHRVRAADLTDRSGRPACPGLRFGDPRVVALFQSLSCFQLNAFGGFRCQQLRSLVEEYLAAPYSTGQAAYDLCRLPRKGLLTRLPRSHRYQLTAQGRLWVTFCSSLYSRVLCPGLRQHRLDQPPGPLGAAFRAYTAAVDAHLVAVRRAA